MYVVSVLPDFTAAGLLPPGVHHATWSQFSERFGEGATRQRLLAGLLRAATSLRNAGARSLWIDGSFVTDKDEPDDFDGAWEFTQIRPGEVDPVLVDIDDLENGCLRQKAKFGGELRIESSRQSFIQFFQKTRDGEEKGIVLLDLRSLP